MWILGGGPYTHICKKHVRSLWGTCEASACVHIWITHPPLACEIGQKKPASQMQAKCKLCKPVLSEVKVFWYPGVDFRRWPICTHYNKHVRSLWGKCEEHVRQCEEHVRWVWGTSEDNVRGSVRNMWGVGNLTTLSFNHRKIVKINQMMGGRRVCRYILKIFHACLHSSSLPLDLVNCLKISASQLQARHKPI